MCADTPCWQLYSCFVVIYPVSSIMNVVMTSSDGHQNESIVLAVIRKLQPEFKFPAKFQMAFSQMVDIKFDKR